MLFFICALHAEAKPLIDTLSLRKDNFASPYETWFSEDSSVVLAISGMGMVEASSATSYLLTRFRFKTRRDFLINFGSCAGKAPGLHLINKITDSVTGRNFYPDMFYDFSSCGLPSSSEKALVTVPKVISSLPDTELLYEMEASAVLQAASHYVPPHRMIFLKYVSDSGTDDPKSITSALLTSCAQKHMPEVTALIKRLSRIDEEVELPDEDEFIAMSYSLHLSETMRNELWQLLMYAKAEGKDVDAVFRELTASGRLPVSSKREGKELLDEIRQKLI